MRYVALLRGVNLGSHNKVSMAVLRQLLAGLDHGEVSTYLQSGNAIFSTERVDVRGIEDEIEREIARALGLSVPVVIRTPEELAAVVAGNPFPQAIAGPRYFHVGFLSEQPTAEAVARLDARQYEPEQFHIGDRAVYLWYPEGAQRAKLSNAVLERRLGVTSTSRNWNTVTKLLELAAD